MANLALSLTQRICTEARPEAREYLLRDTRQPGLGLRVQPCGSRSWIMRLRENGKLTRRSLGTFPETDVKTARRIAAALLAGDATPPARSSQVPTFAEFQAEYEARHARGFKPSGLRSYRTYVTRRLLPTFGAMRLDAIGRPDVVRWFDGYSRQKPGGANRALGILAHILASARAWGHLPDGWRNPASSIRMNRRRIVGSFLSEAQMVRLGSVLDRRMAESCAAAALLRFLTLTGCRVGEIIALQWGDVVGNRLCLRDSKTGPREVLLGAPASRFLREFRTGLPRQAQTKLAPVFPLMGGQRYEAVRSVWISIRREAGLPPKLRIHDLRHSFASHAVMSGETLFTTSKLLGHSRVQMTARYAHLSDDALLAAAERLGVLILRQCGARTGTA